MDDSSAFWCLVFGALIGYWIFSPSKEADEFTVFNKACHSTEYSQFDCPTTMFTYKISYIASRDKQVVVSKSGGGLTVRRYESCVVYDAKNWECTHSYLNGDDVTYYLRDGDYSQYPPSLATKGQYAEKLPVEVQISSFEYHIRETLAFLKRF